ncbi:uncharacterized protein TNCV_3359611 [Trichonephila clavipes]|nr:uncharacterized protein TNCV_3359611 [Trichonephila clavipes]
MTRRRIRAHYESEFESGRIIGLIEADRRIPRPMGRSDASTNGWTVADFSVLIDESRFQVCPDDHRRRVWRRPGQDADPSFTIARHTNPEPGVMVWGVLLWTNEPF